MTVTAADGLKVWCPLCQQIQPTFIEDLRRDQRNPDAWGDVCCNVCFFVIATFSHDKEGEITVIVKAKE